MMSHNYRLKLAAPSVTLLAAYIGGASGLPSARSLPER